ncbi:GerAB/ArcD/ProY family transporter [Paenibacillus thermoaerophilus]|uniref:GerAB/ArcD/ProY family transporter n=1 Tax=Paenibacillus thermoaerophilus TaxID=1215385 RepID=A0ABW2V2C5_9BACL|nr:GerAB/ArcD/ProY family transporter [Paenibacillus thermoaerophilus]TMV09386.1 spore gernimation protein GerB [Paenibacillus thermoaerophilus]
MSSNVNERFQISPFLILFVIHAMQWGVGYLSFQREVAQFAGQDAWIAVILTGISFHIVIWMMYRIFRTYRNQTDLVHIHRNLFGKWIGGLLTVCFIVYLVMYASMILRSFIETIQVWIFPQLQTWVLGLVLLLLAYYVVLGGFRVIVGICLVSFVHYIFLPTYFFLGEYFHFSNLTPILEHSMTDLLQASKQMSFSYLGVEILLICYPFIKNPKQSHKWAHAANAVLTLFYLSLIVFSLAFYSLGQLMNEEWPTLTLFKFVQLPFVERFEFVGVSFNLFRVLPILCLALWAASRTGKLLFSVKQSKVVPFCLLAVFTVVCLLPNRQSINAGLSFMLTIGFYLVYAYIPLLFVLHLFRKKERNPI